jgi:hypothetical protein
LCALDVAIADVAASEESRPGRLVGPDVHERVAGPILVGQRDGRGQRQVEQDDLARGRAAFLVVVLRQVLRDLLGDPLGGLHDQPLALQFEELSVQVACASHHTSLVRLSGALPFAAVTHLPQQLPGLGLRLDPDGGRVVGRGLGVAMAAS